ncbi:hypothetical protein VNO77_27437 [Canavalia gladiata]|uniref:Uncharacterized protein n=1 Tax=Canavalia gladiata TaxID=3824 RepID=A0AAN9KU47_CANGL
MVFVQAGMKWEFLELSMGKTVFVHAGTKQQLWRNWRVALQLNENLRGPMVPNIGTVAGDPSRSSSSSTPATARHHQTLPDFIRPAFSGVSDVDRNLPEASSTSNKFNRDFQASVWICISGESSLCSLLIQIHLLPNLLSGQQKDGPFFFAPLADLLQLSCLNIRPSSLELCFQLILEANSCTCLCTKIHWIRHWFNTDSATGISTILLQFSFCSRFLFKTLEMYGQVPTCPLCVSELMLVLFSYCIRNISVDLPKASLISAPVQPGLYVIHGPRLTVFRFTIHAPGIWEPIHQPIALHLILVDWFLVSM